MKHIEVKELLYAVPVPPAKMTRQEKLLRWAKLVREANSPLYLYSNLEYMTMSQLHAFTVVAGHNTAFSVAIADPEFKAQGLENHSLAGVLKFFELTTHEAHAFSCDCGGHIDNVTQARRIEALAFR